MSEDNKKTQHGAVQTTGHAWDGDLQEFNNPLPRWWLWAFYAGVVFAIIYWVLYPAWPIGKSFTQGILTNTYLVDGKEVTRPWNTRGRFIEEMQGSEVALMQRQYLEQIANADYDAILNDSNMMAFSRSMAKGLFGDNCAACHGAGGTGVMGLYPNLRDDAWLWGGSTGDIENSIRNGHQGYMPSFRHALSEQQMSDTAGYVLSLSGHEVPMQTIIAGRRVFQGQAGGCYLCHGEAGTGNKQLGAANLTDQIWTVADVPGQSGLDGKIAVVKNVINGGVKREMPAWNQRLSDTEIKLLTVYVYAESAGH